jgi:hypothetical protein
MCKRLTYLVALVILLGPTQGDTAYGFSPNTDPSLVALWKLDETSGTTAADSSGNGHAGTLMNGPVWVGGQIGGALQLDGSNDYVDCGNSTDFNLTSQVTLAAWVKVNNIEGTGHECYITKGDTAYALKEPAGTGAIEFFIYDGSWHSANITGLTSSFDGAWHHLAGTFDGSNLRIYLDGVLQNTLAYSATISTNTANVNIGRDQDGGGRRYYGGQIDDVRVYSRALTEAELQAVMTGGGNPALAQTPRPEDKAEDVPRDIVLSWTPGQYAVQHDIYVGTTFADVNDASATNLSDIQASLGQDANTFAPGRLEFRQTYYWRVDEVNALPDGTVFKGNVWSFMTEPALYPVTNIVAAASCPNDVDRSLENAVNGSGLVAGNHSSNEPDMWVGNPMEGEPAVLQFDFDRVYKLDNVHIWNYNHQFEIALRFGLKDVTIEYSSEPNEWTVLDDFQLSPGTGKASYAGQSLDFGGVAAQSVRITATSNFGGQKYGLSEIQFYYIPAHAREPQPAVGATGVSLDPTLSWRAGREAAAHEIHFGGDAEQVSSGAALIDMAATARYDLSALDLATTYYWRVDEVNAAEAISTWEGDVWSFTTQRHTVIDDFESYTDDEGSRIFDVWLDGYEFKTNGSVVGNDNMPYSEGTIVSSGDWSMPFFYHNVNGAVVAEAELAFADPQDWTQGGAKTLAVHFYGASGNTGQPYLKINGTKVPYAGDAADLNKAQWQQWLVDLSTVVGNMKSVTTLTIGIDGAGAEGTLYFDDIRLYPDPAETITPVQPDTAGLIVRYSFDEGLGTVVRDTSGSGNNGAINGSPAWVTGKYSSALSFNGVSDYVGTDKSLLSHAGEFTIACWLNADISAAAARSGLVGQNDCVEYGFASANTLQIWTPNGGSVDFDWPYDSLAEWHHLVAVGDGTSLTIYLDGKAVATGGSQLDEDDDGYGASTSFVNIAGGGIMDATGNWLAGQIDEVYIYRRALSAAEVAGLAGRTQPIFRPL